MTNTENPIRDKSYKFAKDIVTVYKALTVEKKEFVLSKQLIRSGTSIGANVQEAIGGQSSKDFKHKMAIAYREALETEYWLKLLRDTGYLTEVQADPLLDRVLELLKMLGKIQQTMKAKDAH